MQITEIQSDQVILTELFNIVTILDCQIFVFNDGLMSRRSK